MNPTTPIPYDQAVTEAYKHYHANTYGYSEYQEQDYKAGYADGYNAALNNVALRNRQDSLREQVAIAAMQGFISNPTWMANLADVYWKKYKDNEIATQALTRELAKSATECADALITQLNTPKQ